MNSLNLEIEIGLFKKENNKRNGHVYIELLIKSEI